MTLLSASEFSGAGWVSVLIRLVMNSAAMLSMKMFRVREARRQVKILPQDKKQKKAIEAIKNLKSETIFMRKIQIKKPNS